MADPKRLESHATEAADRDSRTEALLVEGLDRYFAGHYEEAIHIWTRVLFLDRSHARARAYIDRARTTLAERQRQSEEMLEASHDLLEQGRTEDARQLLTEAVATMGDDEKAAALRVKLERLERLESAHSRRRASDRRPNAGAMPAPLRAWSWSWRTTGALLVLGGAVVALTFAALDTRPSIATWLNSRSPNEQLAVRAVPSKWPPVLTSSDVALVRARNLYSRGRLAEALQALDRVDAGGPSRVAADDLRTEIQQMLLTGGPDRVPSKADRR